MVSTRKHLSADLLSYALFLISTKILELLSYKLINRKKLDSLFAYFFLNIF